MPNSQSEHFLISPTQDYAFIAGSAVFGYAVFALMLSGVVNIAPFAMILLFVLEGTHIFSTWTRSYLDPEHRQKLGLKRLAQIVPLCLFAMLFVYVGAETLFFAITIVWLHTHVSKQHVGFLALYKRKAGEFEDMAAETKFYKVMMYAPVVFFLVHKVIGLKGYVIAGMIALVPAIWYGLREVERRHVSVPKLVLVGLTVPLQWLAFGYAISSPSGAKAAGVILAFSHTLQYHTLMVTYHREDAKTAKTRKLWHSFAGYAAIGIILNIALYVVPKYGIGNEYLTAALWGLIFQHYLLDGYIWKTKDYPLFAKSLNLA